MAKVTTWGSVGESWRLREQEQPVVGLNGGERPRDRQRFVNARAQWYWELRIGRQRTEEVAMATQKKPPTGFA